MRRRNNNAQHPSFSLLELGFFIEGYFDTLKASGRSRRHQKSMKPESKTIDSKEI
jgi:hypothetical protein